MFKESDDGGGANEEKAGSGAGASAILGPWRGER
jgi:hypothetical protein